MPGREQVQPLTAVVADRRWRFAGMEFDERTLNLRIGGEPVEVEPRPLGILRHLLLHAGEVVTKDELAEAVWPRRILSESVLAKTVSRLREVLGDDEQRIIKTVHGYGYRLIAQVQVEESHAPERTQLNLAVGDHPPQRPLWNLEQRLGSGGHGEAWRARHEKTHEQRVFKFALDEASLIALKREITLFRVINDTLGEQARVVNLLDWNLEQLPYFIESEFIVGGSLLDWAQARGGLGGIPLSDRLEVVAQIAEALAAVHLVGVLHKDLKPSNILVVPVKGNQADIRLADFGSGGVLDLKQIEKLGITRMGFTRTVVALDTTSGTPLYLAPEVVAGQPFTVKSDIYALGVILYQFVVGDFRTGISPGWERGVEDELLREDIAHAAEGVAEARLGDAGELARRLRSLEKRSRQREYERDAQARAERAQRALERTRARRVGIVVAIVALGAGLIASTTLYIEARKARDTAEAKSLLAQGVSDFISYDMLARLTSGKASVKDLTVRQLLDSAAGEIDKRFADQPETAAAVHAALGRSYLSLEIDDQAGDQLLRALDFYQQRGVDEATLKLASDTVPLTYSRGTIRSEMSRFTAILKAGEDKFGPADPGVVRLKKDVARGWLFVGEWSRGASELQAILDLGTHPTTDEDRYSIAETELILGHALDDLADFTGAENHLRRALVQMTELRGGQHLDVARARLWLGHVLCARGGYDEAQREYSASEAIFRSWVDENSGYVSTHRLYRAEMLIERGDPSAAIAVLEQPTAYNAATGYHAAIDQSWYFLEPLAIAYRLAGRMDDAQHTMQQALTSVVTSSGAEHPASRRIRIELADILQARGRLTEARAMLQPEGKPIDLSDLPPGHPIAAELLQVTGFLEIAEGKVADGRPALQRALEIFERVYGIGNWRSVRLSTALKSSAQNQEIH